MAVAAAAIIGLFAAAADAGPVETLYGQGVHQFFRGDLASSARTLGDCVAAGSRDPRVFYFRGLALAGAGRTDEAEADFVEAARLEASGAGGGDVGRALERIQGYWRYAIEKHRLSARIAIGLNAAGRRRESVLAPPLPAPSSPGPLRGPRPVPESVIDVPAEREEVEPVAPPRPADPAEPAKPMTAEPEGDDPFGEKPAPPKPKTGGDDPFGDDPFGDAK